MRKLLSMLLLAIVCVSHVYAQKLTCTKEEANVIQLYGKEMSHQVNIASEDALAEMQLKYLYNRNDLEHLRRLFEEREQRKAAHNYLERNPMERVVEKQRIDSLYQDSINALLIPYNSNISGEIISLSLRMSDALRLSKKEHRRLMEKALDFARRLRKNPYTNFKKEEMDVLKKNLSAKQLETVIDEKNGMQAQVKAQRAWNALEEAGVAYELDSLPNVSRARLYYLIEMRYWDMYVEQNEVRDRNLQDLYRSKPKIIKMYEALDEKKRIKEKKEKSVGVEFSW
ncbi:MAG: hypothetical protein PUC18_00965 [Prevotellaceae bacterium]|nr:hypothetical protein [Prevotellaceae bacterium]